MQLLENLSWRYATKKYDSSKKVTEEDLDKILEAILLTATSYGLQLFKVLNITDEAVREQLKPASWGQPQLTDASHILVFCGYSDVKNEHIDEYLDLKATTQGLNVADLSGYGDFIKNQMENFPTDVKKIWTNKQAYIALSTAMVACAELKIDSTPMEGFDPAQYDAILGLSEKGLQASVVLAIGYRSEEDETQHGAKVRKSIEALVETI